MGAIQEGMHSIHCKGLKPAVLKIDLSKAYDRVSWTFLQVILSKTGFDVSFITWVMSSLTSISFSILINGVASRFFRSGRGLKQGCPLAPLLFPVVVEGLGRAPLAAKECGTLRGVSFGNNISLTHVLFMDDIVMITDGSTQPLSTLYEILMDFSKASRMMINEDKSSFYYSGLDDRELISLQNFFSFTVLKIESGMKYLGFFLKPCRYLLKDWDWLIAKAEKRIKNWSYRWLSRGGKLILIKSVLEALPVYWMHFWILVGIIEKIRKLFFKFVWSGSCGSSSGLPWTSWKVLENPKFLG